ncbi:MAG: conjugal transfer mating pair stabilization protein TraG [Gammaproteobacteria bacterium]|nr:conjugal transfer mating pair stabilization protein TraG [Gammaproteobacteria bacterium]
MSTIPVYVISNGELAREVFNAVATLIGTGTFATAIKISILFSILGAAINYIRGKDIVIIAKWFIIYFAITSIMLSPKVDLEIIDSSNPGAVYTVGKVPYGIGYPVSIITSVSYGLVSAFESAFHTPDDFTYNKTGMLFGSKVFRLSTEFHIINPEVKSELNEYVKNCVIGDMLITKKYSMSELTESGDLLGTITKEPSNIRGIYIGGIFKTCLAAKNDLKSHLEKDVKENGFRIFGKRIFGRMGEKRAAEKLETSLTGIYNYFNYGDLSNTAMQIATQNLLINGVRDGITNYTAETGATAALLNLSTTQAMERMRMSLATSRNIATYIIPVMHTVLLLLMISLFPVIVLLAFQPNLTSQVLKNYLYTLLWIESWPLMFACLNLIVTFYTTSDIGPARLTISSIDQLALEHSDIANMAGYLMLSIPFISGGLVKGMSSAFNTAANYIGGVLQSSASSAASEAASGNIHLGNSSWNNVNANKFDTNSIRMHGMATEQLGTGVLRTSRPDGDPIYDSSHAISRLPTNVRSSDLLSSSFSEQAEASRTAAVQDQKSYDQSVSNSISDVNSLGNSLDSRKSMGESFSSREALSVAQSTSDMKNIANTIAERNHMDTDDVFRGLVNFSQRGGLDVGGSVSGKTAGVGAGGVGGGIEIGLKGTLGTEHIRTNESSTRHGIGKSIDVTAEEAQRFSNDLHKVEEYSKTSHGETGKSEAMSHLSQLSTDLRNARSASEQYSIHKSESERLSSVASFVRQHSGQIDSDMSQEIANYVVKREGQERAEVLFAGKDRTRLEALSKEYIRDSGVGSSIISKYEQSSSNIKPERKYQSGQVGVESRMTGINMRHKENKQKIESDVATEMLGVDHRKYKQLTDDISGNNTIIGNKIEDIGSAQKSRHEATKDRVTRHIDDGSKKARSSAFSLNKRIKPNFLNHDEKKK